MLEVIPANKLACQKDANIITEVFQTDVLWEQLRFAARRDYLNRGVGFAHQTHKLPARLAKRLADMTDAQVTLALEREITRLSKGRTNTYTLVTVRVRNTAIFQRTRWRRCTVAIVYKPSVG